jgi:hypothetical protein
MRILFCGNTFPWAPEFLQERLAPESHDEVVGWSGGERIAVLEGVDVVVP